MVQSVVGMGTDADAAINSVHSTEAPGRVSHDTFRDDRLVNVRPGFDRVADLEGIEEPNNGLVTYR